MIGVGRWYHVSVVDLTGARRGRERAVAGDARDTRADAAPRFSPAASAAALALALAADNALVHPWVPTSSHADALFNEWIIWFTAWYLALVAVAAVLERVRTLYRSRVRPDGADGAHPPG